MQKTALILTGLLLLPTAVRPHTNSDIQKVVDLSHAKGLVDSSCGYAKLGLLLVDEEFIGIHSAFLEYRHKYGLTSTRKLADMVLKDYPECASSFPRQYLEKSSEKM